jgi:hypothetical protein
VFGSASIEFGGMQLVFQGLSLALRRFQAFARNHTGASEALIPVQFGTREFEFVVQFPDLRARSLKGCFIGPDASFNLGASTHIERERVRRHEMRCTRPGTGADTR